MTFSLLLAKAPDNSSILHTPHRLTLLKERNAGNCVKLLTGQLGSAAVAPRFVPDHQTTTHIMCDAQKELGPGVAHRLGLGADGQHVAILVHLEVVLAHAGHIRFHTKLALGLCARAQHVDEPGSKQLAE